MKSNASKSERGSVIAGILALGVVVVLGAYFVAKQSMLNERASLEGKINHDANVVTNRVFANLADTLKCRATFATTLTPNAVVSHLDPSTQLALQTSSNGGRAYGNSKITITSYELVNSVPHPLVHVVYANPNLAAKPVFRRSIKMWVKWGTDPSAPVEDCKAITDTDQIWNLGNGVSIFHIGDDPAHPENTKAGIGKSNPSATLDVSGSVFVTAAPPPPLGGPPAATDTGRVLATEYLYPSDHKLKENISEMNDPLAQVLELRGVSFRWRQSGRKDYGFIAQETKEVFPDLIREDGSKRLTVDYAKLIPVVLEAVKAQQAQIDSLKSEIRRLRR